jgi:ferrochelatase
MVLPLYPQYSASTSASTFDALALDFQRRRYIPELRFVSAYHDNDAYIQALANSIIEFREKHGEVDKLVFSYHGVPLRYLHNGDPYHCFCHQTTRLVAEKLGLAEGSYMTTFQSRFGREPWLQPYTDETLKRLPSEGCASMAVICPGFAADCLETLEEIEEENKEYFLEAGGNDFHYIPALNSRDDHLEALTEICLNNTQDWFEKLNRSDSNALAEERYNSCKARLSQETK